MNTAIINFTTEPKLKAEAQKVAKKIGIPLSLALNNYLRHFVETKTVTFREEIPNARTVKIFKQAEKNWKEGKTSPLFDTGEDAVKWLEDHGV